VDGEDMAIKDRVWQLVHDSTTNGMAKTSTRDSGPDLR
jgi:hypothetical protein